MYVCWNSHYGVNVTVQGLIYHWFFRSISSWPELGRWMDDRSTCADQLEKAGDQMVRGSRRVPKHIGPQIWVRFKPSKLLCTKRSHSVLIQRAPLYFPTVTGCCKSLQCRDVNLYSSPIIPFGQVGCSCLRTNTSRLSILALPCHNEFHIRQLGLKKLKH